MNDPIGPLTAADTLLISSWVQPLTVPPELTSIFPPQWASVRCIMKPAGQLRFALNSVLDLGFPAPLSFDVTFVGTVLQAATPMNPVAVIRFDVNEVVQMTFTLPGGPSVLIDTVTGKITPACGYHQPLAGTSCSGQPRVFDVRLVWLRGLGVPPILGVDLTVVMFIDGQQRTLTLSMNFLDAQSGEPELERVPRPVYAKWWEILMEHLPVPGGPPPPPPWREAMQDALLGLASAQFAWVNHVRADGRRLQQAALGTVEAALVRMRGIVDQAG